MEKKPETEKSQQTKHHAQQAADRFDSWAESYNSGRITSWFRHYQSDAMTRMDLAGGPGFLEVACGTGWAVKAARAHVLEGTVAGIDISPKMHEVAKQDAPEGVEFQLGEASEIPYDDETFHSILCSCAFHHFPRPGEALREIHRVLRPNGTFVLLDASRNVSWWIWLQDRGRRLFEKSHVRYYTTRELRAFVESAGFRLDRDVETFSKFRDHGKLFTGLAMLTCKKR